MSDETAITTTVDQSVIEQVVVQGDLSQLTPEQRVRYYHSVCESLGLNPLTQPFAYIRLNGKLTLYAKRDAADQLRKIHAISIDRPDVTIDDGLVMVSVTGRDKAGRTDSDLGVVSIGTLKGDQKANAILKAVTKAKRRLTLSIVGLGWLDETEVETIPDAEIAQEPITVTAPPAQTQPAQAQTPKAERRGQEEYGPVDPEKWDALPVPQDYTELYNRVQQLGINDPSPSGRRRHAANIIKQVYPNNGASPAESWQALIDHQRSKIEAGK